LQLDHAANFILSQLILFVGLAEELDLMFRLVSSEISRQIKNRHRVAGVRSLASGVGSTPSNRSPPSDTNDELPEHIPSASPSENPELYLKERDELQRQYLQKKKGHENVDMPPDLREFIQTAPIIVEDYSSTQPVTPRLPRYMREEEQKKGTRPDFNDGRIVEKMPLVEKIQGFDTMRTTNFSRIRDVVSSRVYQGGDAVDIFDLLRRRDNGEDPDALVEKVYAEYEGKHALPDAKCQELHKQLLKSTLKYLRIPTLMRNPEGGMFDGVPADRVEEFEMFHKVKVVPKTTAKFVLEDLLDDGRKTEIESPPSQKKIE